MNKILCFSLDVVPKNGLEISEPLFHGFPLSHYCQALKDKKDKDI